jgi:hypothetical protein
MSSGLNRSGSLLESSRLASPVEVMTVPDFVVLGGMALCGRLVLGGM